MLPLPIKSSKILIQNYSKKKVSDGGECAWPCHGMKKVEEQWDRENARGEVKSLSSLWLSLWGGRNFQKSRCCRFLQTLFRQQPHSEEAQDAWTKSLPNMGPKLSSSGFNNWSDQKDLIGHPSGICWEKKIRLTKFIEIAEHSCCRFLKRWCWVFAGACYLPTGITVLWDLRLFIP